MAILSCVSEVAGQSNTTPQVIKINCTDALSAVTAVGYANGLLAEGFKINPSDIVLINYNGGIGFFSATIVGTVVTFKPILSSLSGLQTLYGGLTLNSGNLSLGSSSSLLIESASDNLTAHAGGGQGSALALVSEINRITTVATAGDSVALPAASPGLSIVIINSGANAMQVFGAGTDTINDVATATGVSQMPNSVAIYSCSVAGKWYANHLGRGFAGSLPTYSNANGITAHAGGGQGSATPLTNVINRIVTVATGGDSVLLPASSPGLQITVINSHATNSANVFPQSGDQINALGANTAFALAATKVAIFSCSNSGQWHSLLTA